MYVCMYVYIYIYVCMYVCICDDERGWRKGLTVDGVGFGWTDSYCHNAVFHPLSLHDIL